MRKIYLLRPEGKNPDRVLEAVKHDIRKYIKRERRRELPEGASYWDFDCRLGADKDSAQTVHPAELIKQLDALAAAGSEQSYVEVLAKPGVRRQRPLEEGASTEEHTSETDAAND